MALEVDLLGEGGPAAKADTLFYRSREAYKSRQIDDLWRAKAATSPKSLGAVIVSDAVLDHVRRELRRQTGHNVEAKELRDLIRKKVLHRMRSSPPPRTSRGLPVSTRSLWKFPVRPAEAGPLPPSSGRKAERR